MKRKTGRGGTTTPKPLTATQKKTEARVRMLMEECRDRSANGDNDGAIKGLTSSIARKTILPGTRGEAFLNRGMVKWKIGLPGGRDCLP